MNSKSHRRHMSELIASGALAGGVAANSMTLLRMLARRRGIIEKTVPQAMEERLLEALDLQLPGGHLSHHALDQLMHVGYGSMLGAASGFLFKHTRRHTIRRGITIGLVTWTLGSLIIMPLFGAGRAPWKAEPREAAVNITSHLLFGLWSAMLIDELVRQSERGPSGAPDRMATRVG